MAGSPRLFAFAALGVGPLLLFTACGADASGARQPLVPVQPSSYVVQDPVPTTTTTTVPPNATVPEGQVSPQEQIYTIVSGDSISRIASRYGITNDDLINYNEWSDGLDHLLIPGQTVRIPPQSIVPGAGGSTGGGTGTPTPGAGGDDGVTQPSEAPAGCTHTIESGENPTRVANRYDITVDQLREANPGVIDTFVVGQTLVIPPGGDC